MILSNRSWNLAVGGLLILSAVVASIAWGGEKLTVDQYLAEVRTHHDGVKASIESSQGALERSHEGDTITAPALLLSAQKNDDRQLPVLFTPVFPLSGTETTTYSAGVQQTTSFGLTGKVSYNLGRVYLIGLPTNSGNPYYAGRPQLDLTLSLWRNGFGSETRATQQVIEASALASHYDESFRTKVTLADAEATYWRMALARENVQIQKDALARAQKIYDWNLRRSRLQLGEQSDVLQANANVQLRRLQQQSALDEQRSASLAFNEARGSATEAVPEELVGLDANTIDNLLPPPRTDIRDDVKSAEQQTRAANANAVLGSEKTKPTLELFGTFARNSREPLTGDAFTHSFNPNQPTTLYGVRLVAPFDLGTLKETRSGYEKQQTAADLNYQRKLFEQERDWTDLTEKLTESKNRLKLWREIEETQQKKLDLERERLHRGRTTTYTVLLFEQDYSQAQFSRIQAQADVLTLFARLKLFGAHP